MLSMRMATVLGIGNAMMNKERPYSSLSVMSDWIIFWEIPLCTLSASHGYLPAAFTAHFCIQTQLGSQGSSETCLPISGELLISFLLGVSMLSLLLKSQHPPHPSFW
jgi:hypothetical protein